MGSVPSITQSDVVPPTVKQVRPWVGASTIFPPAFARTVEPFRRPLAPSRYGSSLNSPTGASLAMRAPMRSADTPPGYFNSGPTGPAPACNSPADYSGGLGAGEAFASSLAEVCFSWAAADCDFP